MNTFDLLESYEQQADNEYANVRRRNKRKKTRSCWREIEKVKEKRRLTRELVEYQSHNILDGLEEVFL